jgi:hypothetical protein
VAEEAGRYLCIAALLAAGLLGAWTAWACHQARLRGLPGSDALAWAAMALLFLLGSQTKLARVLGWVKGLGGWLRLLAREHHLYENRRPFQIAASIAVAAVIVVLLAIGLIFAWDAMKRYRLAIGFTALGAGFGVIRFISLHEVDAWNAQMPWLRVVVELIAAAGASAVAIVRLGQLGELARLRRTCGGL